MRRPTNKQAFKRLIVLKHIVVHALTLPPKSILADTAANWSQDDRNDFENKLFEKSRNLLASIKRFGASNEISKRERAFLNNSYFSIEEYEQIAASWRVECVLILMWAFNIEKDFPLIDQQADHEILKKLPEANVGFIYNGPKLRRSEEIDQKRDFLEFWHWRARTRQLIESGDPIELSPEMQEQGLNSYDDIVRMSARHAYEAGDFSEIIDEDFPVKGQAFRDLSDEDYQEMNSIIMERHYALNWLCGRSPGNKWDDTPTDT